MHNGIISRVIGIPWMLWTAVCIHATVGTALIISPVQTDRFLVLSGLDLVRQLTHYQPNEAVYLGVMLIAASIIASFGLIQEKHLSRIWTLIFLTPQYLILLGSLATSILIIGEIVINDNYRGRAFDAWAAAAILAPIFVVATLHTLQIFDRYAVRWHRSRHDAILVNAFEKANPENKLLVMQALNIQGMFNGQ